MRDDLLRLIRAKPACVASDALFDALALRLFSEQFERNAPYRQFCLLQKKTPDCVRRWDEIPPLPVTAFKVADIVCRPMARAARVFHSSGTTGQTPSRHALFDLELSQSAIASHFARHLIPEGQRMRLAILTASPEEAPHASLAHMMETVRVAFGTSESRYYIERGRLQSERLVYDLAEATSPVCLLGTSFSFVHLIDFYARHGFPCVLPAGSRLMDTGGFKGKSREVAREWIYARAEALWGIRPENCVNEYGMTEMTSQFYDGVVGEATRDDAPRVYRSPPQVRTRVLSPATLAPVPHGEMGLLAHYDLANRDSALAVLTEDLGHEANGGFILIGRATGAQARGCSLTLDDFEIAAS